MNRLMRLLLAVVLGVVISVHNSPYKRGQIPSRTGPITDNAPASGPRQMQSEYSSVMLEPAGPAAQPVRVRYPKLPVCFEPNRGEVDARVEYFARAKDSVLFLTQGNWTLLYGSRGPGETLPSTEAIAIEQGQLSSLANESRPKRNVAERHFLHMRLVGSNHSPLMKGLGELPGRSNYFIGNDPKNWQVGVPTYAAVGYTDVYAGVDLTYHGADAGFEYDFTVAPGADAGAIRLGFDAAQLRLNEGGDLVVSTDDGQVVQRRPFAYQDVDGNKTPVPCSYSIDGRGDVGFQVGSYDEERPLVIDPIFSYSTYFGGGADDFCTRLAVDSSGCAYLTGLTEGIQFPTTSGAFQPTKAGGQFDAFVAKMSADGSGLVYSTYLGGGGDDDEGRGIKVDASGSAYIAGVTNSTNFPTTPNAYQAGLRGKVLNAFVAKLDSSGSQLLYSTYLGGTSAFGDGAFGIAIDDEGNAYLTGSANSPDFPVTPGAFQRLFGTAPSAFVSKLDTTTGRLVYSTSLTGSNGSAGIGIMADSQGNAYVTGDAGDGFPTTPGCFQATFIANGDAFLSKLDPTGSTLVYSTLLGGFGNDVGVSVAVDADGNAYLCGRTASTDFPVTPGAFQTTNGGQSDAFVTKFDPTGSSLIYSTYLGGTGVDQGFDIDIDRDGNAYVTGDTTSKNFPTANAIQDALSGSDDAFVTKLDPSGKDVVYSTFVGGNGSEGFLLVNAIAVDPDGNAYAAGSTDSTDFPVTKKAFQRKNAGGIDCYLLKISGPVIKGASVAGKKLLLSGHNFDQGAIILIDGIKQRTRNDDQNPGALLIAPKAAKKLTSGTTVTLQVANSDGTTSLRFNFAVP